jgi:hypothetical protein
MPLSKSKRKAKRKKTLRRFKSGLTRMGLSNEIKIVNNPSGSEKMSETFMRFVAPYAEFAETEEDYRRLYSMAALAWNATFLPEEERSMLDAIIREATPSAEDEARLVINELIHRKERYFAQYNKMIMHYEVNMVDDYVHVRVAYTMP